MENLTENVIEWVTGDSQVTVTLSQKKYITKIKKMAIKHPDEVTIIHENSDGSIVAHLPLKSIKISITSKNFTEEQRLAMAERMRNMRNGNSDEYEEYDDEDEHEDYN